MPRARTNGVEIEYETFGDASHPTLLLVQGFSLQLLSWHETFCEHLAARGFRVVRFDNRDVGLSTKIEGRPAPRIGAIMGGDASSVPYALDAMADDTRGLLDALDVPAAHVVGVSMGGMISQLLALRHPSRVKSLCSIMSTTGDPAVGHARPETLAVLFTPTPIERTAAIAWGVETWRMLASPGFPFDEARVRAGVARAFDRAFYPLGSARQLAAILSAPDRTKDLASIDVPTLVIHGKDDPLIGVSGGEATARAIPGAELVVIDGMGHDLPEALWPRIEDAIVANALRAK